MVRKEEERKKRENEEEEGGLFIATPQSQPCLSNGVRCPELWTPREVTEWASD